MRHRVNTRVLDCAIRVAEKTTTRVLKLYALLFLLAIAAIIYEIVARSLGQATVLATEMSGYIMASLIAWGSAYALFQKAHIRIDILYARRSNPIKNLLDTVSIFLFFLAAGFLAWSTVGLTLESIEYSLVSNTTLRIPMWAPQASWALGFTWLSVCAALLTVKAILSWVNNDRDSMMAAVGAGDEAHL